MRKRTPLLILGMILAYTTYACLACTSLPSPPMSRSTKVGVSIPHIASPRFDCGRFAQAMYTLPAYNLELVWGEGVEDCVEEVLGTNNVYSLLVHMLGRGDVEALFIPRMLSFRRFIESNPLRKCYVSPYLVGEYGSVGSMVERLSSTFPMCKVVSTTAHTPTVYYRFPTEPITPNCIYSLYMTSTTFPNHMSTYPINVYSVSYPYLHKRHANCEAIYFWSHGYETGEVPVYGGMADALSTFWDAR